MTEYGGNGFNSYNSGGYANQDYDYESEFDENENSDSKKNALIFGLLAALLVGVGAMSVILFAPDDKEGSLEAQVQQSNPDQAASSSAPTILSPQVLVPNGPPNDLIDTADPANGTEKTGSTPNASPSTSPTAAQEVTPSPEDGEPTPPPATAAPSNGKPVVHLTFDDGPSDLTPKVLDVLDKYNAKGTFFVMGSTVEKKPDIAREIVNRGHAIGNHSYDHMDWRQAGAREDIIKTQKIIVDTTGVSPSCARPPFGADSPQLIATLGELGMKSWRWDIDTVDHKRIDMLNTVPAALDTISSRPNIWGAEGKIVLQHDSDMVLEDSLIGLERWLETNADSYQFKVIDNCLNYQ